MKFNTTHNGAIIAIEFDDDFAADQDGTVCECEVTYNGQIVTELLLDQYEAFLMECEHRYAARQERKGRQNAEDAAISRYESRMEVMRGAA